MGPVWIFITIGGAIGSYLPVIFGVGGFSPWSIVCGTIGSLVGIWVFKKMDL